MIRRRSRRLALKTTTLRLGPPQDAWLTMVSARIRQRTGVGLDRSAVLRGALDGLRTGGLELDACGSEADIREMVAYAVRGEGHAASGVQGRCRHSAKGLMEDPTE
jgi:hypothetical protein